MSNPGRARILARIRAALPSAPAAPPSDHGLAPFFAPIADPLARFQAECELNKTELHLVEDAHAAEALAALLLSEPAEGGIFIEDAAPLRRLAAGLPERERARLRWSSSGAASASDIAGITLAEALVARTGSVLLSSAGAGRAASVLPPLHVVFARPSQLVDEIETALIQARVRHPGASMLCLVTGPSRTADIEKLLVLGAHGPRRLAVLLARD